VPTQIGSYPIEREIGRGGMGVVYLGRDLRLDRPVAIKVLPDLLSHDSERLARFEREARLLAALTHPHIAGIHGIEESDGRRFLVLEYVEGETLAEHLLRGPLPIDETLKVCGQIAGALEAAHEAGIVHRDLKPGNVKLNPAGDVKVLDFGLAKGASSGGESSSDLSHSPTLTQAATGIGVILGTAAYMSPEQARGKVVDRRTDIWSFGCVLYECLTGEQAFAGETVSDMIARILQGEPDWSRLPAGTPERLRELLHRCLEKDARRRLRDIGDARIAIEELQGGMRPASSSSSMSGIAMPATTPPPRRPGWQLPAAAAALLILGVAAGFVARPWWGAPRSAQPVRFLVQAPPHTTLATDPALITVSPDGRTLAFVANDTTGQASIWVRPLDDFDARLLPGTRNGEIPFWSPDSRQLAFFGDGKLKRIRIAGGNPEVVCDANTGRGGTWNRSGTILFAAGPTGPLYRVPAAGGTPVAVTVLDAAKGETAHRWPSFLPDGEHFLFTALPRVNGQFASYIGSLGAKQRTPLVASGGAPILSGPHDLVFQRNGAIVAQRFDGHQVRGDAVTLGEGAGVTIYSAAPCVSASANGVIVWESAGKSNSRVVWTDRAGHEIGDSGLPPDRWGFAILSHDGRKALVEQDLETGASDLWVVDLERQISNRITYGRGANTPGVWSPDNREIMYGSNRRGPRDLYRRAADGSGTDQVFYQSSVPFKDVADWSPDGRWIVMQENGDSSGWNLYLLPVAGGPRVPYLVTPFNELGGQISPDEKWLLYTSDESGSFQLYVQSFPAPGRKQQVTKTGAVAGLWTANGREIQILRPDFSVASVTVEPGEDLRFGAPVQLMKLPPDTRSWNPTADGKRALITVAAEQAQLGIAVVVDWRAAQKEESPRP
jgi:Tol biopolymer transport system component